MTIAAHSAVARRRTAGAVLLLLAIASLGAAAWGTWLQVPRSYDGNDAWTNRLLWPIENNQPLYGGGTAVAVSADGRVAMAMVDGRLHRTEDGGARWFQRPLPGGRYATSTSGGSVAISADGRRVIATSVNLRERSKYEIAVSDDGGASWAMHDGGDVQGLWYAALSADGMRGLVVGYVGRGRPDGRLFRTVDGGRTWTATAFPTRPVALAADGLHAIMIGLGERVLRTTDGGVTWTTHSVPASRVDWVIGVALSAHGRIGFAVGYQGIVWRSEDGGQTWGAVGAAPQRHFERVVTSSEGRRVLALSHGDGSSRDQVLHISADGGTTWTMMPVGQNLWLDVALSADGRHGIVTGLVSRGVARTSDGGLTWQPPDPPVRQMPYWPYGAAGLAAAFALTLAIGGLRRPKA